MRKFGLRQLAMLAPTQGLLILIIALPSLYVFWLSFTESSYGKAPTFIGWDNYAAIWNDRYFWRALVNTLIVINVIVYGELVLAFLLASVFAKGVPFRKTLLAIVLMPYAISEVVAVVIWKFLLDPNVGSFAKAMAAAGLPDINWATNPTHGLGLVSVVSIWLHLPFTFILIYAAMLAVPKELYESATIDGASGWQSFRFVTLPGVMPAIFVALIFRYILAFRLFSEVWLLTGGGPARTTEVLAIYLYKQSFTYASFGKGSATGWVMVMISGAIAAIYLRLLYSRGFKQDA
ncbi:sugar ABC transporter permease [Alsobacter sp. SYSU M60028]|uniref:Sugar ABC transporter permease n=1 Tax=Alsobacter ponti TaxID=2962936 RepID=A0ABT1LEB8_9HYPH|nr:sugar ABC transporter permease [Alsobacter ponti]MCP8938568.1 sugar ABC transporter permease [Alsobacter ponti]